MDEQNKSPKETQRQAKHFMAFYIIALFSIALVLILLSYLTQVRADDQIASAKTQLQEQVSATQGIQAKMEVLQESNNEQAQHIAELEQEIEALQGENESLTDQVDAQTMLIWALELSRDESTYAQMKEELDTLAKTYGLEALDGSDSEKLLWSKVDAQIFNNLRNLTAENQ